MRLQRIADAGNQVLVLGELAGLEKGDRWFYPNQVEALYQGLRIPPPGDVNRTLTRLKTKGLVIHDERRHAWALTPEGNARSHEIVSGVDAPDLRALLARAPGAELGKERQSTLPPTFAPSPWSEAITRLLAAFPFEANVFCMTRFPEEHAPDDAALARAIDRARSALGDHGLTLHMASDRAIDDQLLGNVGAYMWACQYGVAFFERRGKEEVLNDNLLIEVGAMVMTGRRCALLRDVTAPDMPTDLIGQVYKRVDIDKSESVARAMHAWAANDLGLGRCRNCSADEAPNA